MGFFTHKHIFLKVSLVLLMLFILDIVVLISIGNKTEGRVIQYVYNRAGGSKYPSIQYPVIQYQINKTNHRFNGNWDTDYHRGDIVEVIYMPFWPRRAKINTFWGITKRPLIQFIVVFVIWAMIYSSFKPGIKQFKMKAR